MKFVARILDTTKLVAVCTILLAMFVFLCPAHAESYEEVKTFDGIVAESKQVYHNDRLVYLVTVKVNQECLTYCNDSDVDEGRPVTVKIAGHRIVDMAVQGLNTEAIVIIVCFILGFIGFLCAIIEAGGGF